MSKGLVKPKQYDWKDSNLALFGSDTEKAVKKDAAKTEPAWQGAGEEVSLKIWRIVKFQVTEWNKEEYGHFFNGDSYIVLNTYKPDPDSEELAYDLHFWIGSQSSQDEYGTAAYKTVELDTYLDDKPIQHREVEGYESELFKSYFPKGITLMAGGADTGFNHVTPEEYTPRLFHFSGSGRAVIVTQVPAAKTRLTQGDVFVLDLGLTIYQWNGSGASAFEKNKAMEYIRDLKVTRSGKAIKTEVLEGESVSDEHPFMQALNEPDQHEDFQVGEVDTEPQLYKVSDADGSLDFEKVKSGAIDQSDFNTQDVFILESPKSCFVWVGKGASSSEKANSMGYAHNHMMKTANPLRPIIILKEGQENDDFRAAMAA
jgi:gelsolin